MAAHTYSSMSRFSILRNSLPFCPTSYNRPTSRLLTPCSRKSTRSTTCSAAARATTTTTSATAAWPSKATSQASTKPTNSTKKQIKFRVNYVFLLFPIMLELLSLGKEAEDQWQRRLVMKCRFLCYHGTQK